MIYLAATVVCYVTFCQFLRLGQRRSRNAMLLACANYCAAAAFSIVMLIVASFSTPPQRGDWPFWLVGACNGCLYYLNLLLMLEAFRLAGVGITIAIASSSIVVPMLAAWAIWAEPMSPARWSTVALLPVAMFLLRPTAAGPPPASIDGATARPSLLAFRAELVLLGLFLNSGVINIIHKGVSQYAAALSTHPRPGYQAMLFSAAALSSLTLAIRGGWASFRSDLTIGAWVGIVNGGITLFTLLSLVTVPAVIFFPTMNCVSLLLNVVLARVVWAEKITPRQVAGVVLAAAIVVLVNR